MCLHVSVGMRLYFMATVQHATRKVSSFAHTNTNTITLMPNKFNTKPEKLIAYTHTHTYVTIYIYTNISNWLLEQRRALCIYSAFIVLYASAAACMRNVIRSCAYFLHLYAQMHFHVPFLISFMNSLHILPCFFCTGLSFLP